MGLFDIFKKKKKETQKQEDVKDVIFQTEEKNKNLDLEQEKSLEILKKILKALHEKRYADVANYVDQSEIDNLEDFLSGPVQETLDINNYDTIDEYGVECKFHPQYEYSQITIGKYNDNGDFYLEYDLTSNGEKIDLVLQLDFKHTENGLKCIFDNIDPQ